MMPLMILAINHGKHDCERKIKEQKNRVFLMGKKVNELSLLCCAENAQRKPFPLILATLVLNRK